jgi:hypothetical protein
MTLVRPDLSMTAEGFAAMPPVRAVRIELNEGTIELWAPRRRPGTHAWSGGSPR